MSGQILEDLLTRQSVTLGSIRRTVAGDTAEETRKREGAGAVLAVAGLGSNPIDLRAGFRKQWTENDITCDAADGVM